MQQDTIGPDQSLDEIMQCWPNSISVFLRHKMLCVGCPIASFHTIEDACKEYRLDKSKFIEELLNA